MKLLYDMMMREWLLGFNAPSTALFFNSPGYCLVCVRLLHYLLSSYAKCVLEKCNKSTHKAVAWWVEAQKLPSSQTQSEYFKLTKIALCLQTTFCKISY